MQFFTIFFSLPLIAITSAACVNKSNFCAGWKLVGYCKPSSRHYTWMKENCAKTCDVCPTAPPPGCVDLMPSYCVKMALNCFRDGYKDYMKKNCAKTCKACGNATTQSPVLSTINPSKCGIKGDGHTRIVGGTNARPGDWPWQVQIDLNTDYMRYWCGGTLINDEWILSAAHCFEDDLSPRSYTVYLGEHDIRVKSSNEQKLEIAEIIMHPNYDAMSTDNDMALLRLKRKASFNTFVRPACFPDSSVKFSTGEECFVTGWGALRFNGGSPRILQQAKIPLISQSECMRAEGSSSITRNMFCAGYLEKKVDSCSGDSGGPLVCKKRNSSGQDVWYLWGVVSWGVDCAKSGHYGVYSSVEQMGNWVTSTLNKRKSL